MAEQRGRLGERLDFITDLDSRVVQAAGDRERAAAHRRRYDRLMKGADTKISDAIKEATANLLAFQQTGKLTDEEKLLGVLRINQYVPPKTMHIGGSPDIEQTMAWFHQIQPGAPVIGYHDRFANPYVVARTPVVTASETRGMSGLPEAIISFDTHRVAETPEGIAIASGHTVTLSQTFVNLDGTIVGTPAIQQHLDTQEIHAPYRCGQREILNGERVLQLSHAATNLVAVGFEINMTHIDAKLAEIEAYEQKRRDYLERRTDAEDPETSSRGRYIRRHTRMIN